MRRWAVVGVGILLVGLWWSAPQQEVARQEVAQREGPREVWAQERVAITLSPQRRPQEPREYLAESLPAEGWLGQAVQAAMNERGDSDRRLLDAMAALGIRPSWGASWGAWFDPWLAVGLVDLERQVVRRCAALSSAAGRGGDRCEELKHGVLAAELEMEQQLGAHPAATALALFHQRDQHSERTSSQLERALSEDDAASALQAYQALGGTEQVRAQLLAKGWLEPEDWRDALRVAALRCDPGPTPLLELRARFDGAAWTIQSASAFAVCLESELGEPFPEQPTEVTLLVRR